MLLLLPRWKCYSAAHDYDKEGGQSKGQEEGGGWKWLRLQGPSGKGRLHQLTYVRGRGGFLFEKFDEDFVQQEKFFTFLWRTPKNTGFKLNMIYLATKVAFFYLWYVDFLSTASEKTDKFWIAY